MGDNSWDVGANMTQGKRAMGGRLSIDAGQVGFGPHALDSATGGMAWQCALVDLATIDLAPRTFHPFDGGMRKRLRLRTSDGTEALFVVTSAAKVARRIGESARAAGGTVRVDA